MSRRGTSLLEVLVSVVIFLTVVVMSSQAIVSLRFLSELAQQRTVAIADLNTMIECLRSTPANGWGQPLTQFPAAVGVGIPPTTVQDWNNLTARCGMTSRLPGETILIAYAGWVPAGQIPVMVQWTVRNGGVQTVSAMTRRLRDGL